MDVTAALFDVAGECVHAALEFFKVFFQCLQLVANVAGMAVCGVVFDQGVGAGEQGGKGGGRGYPDAQSLRFFDQSAVAGVQFGKDGFAGQEENGAFCGFRGRDVAVCNVVDVFLQVGAKAFVRGFVVRGGIKQGAVAFQREFGIDA